MTTKQNPVEIDAYSIILHAAQKGMPLGEYLAKVDDYAHKRMRLVTRGMRDE
jgi:hypothetical protein